MVPALEELACEAIPVDSFLQDALAIVVADVAGGAGSHPIPFARVLTLAFSLRVHTARELATSLGVRPSTLMSRFFRAGLPAPKHYVALARLIAAARLLERPRTSIANVALHLEYASPQGFHRHVRLTFGMSARHFREAYTGQAMLEHFRSTLIHPYRETLRTFDPLPTLASDDHVIE